MAESTLLERLAAKHNAEWTMGGALTVEASRRQVKWFLLALADELEEHQGDRVWAMMGDCACDREAMSAVEAFDWLRSQANPDSAEEKDDG